MLSGTISKLGDRLNMSLKKVIFGYLKDKGNNNLF